MTKGVTVPRFDMQEVHELLRELKANPSGLPEIPQSISKVGDERVELSGSLKGALDSSAIPNTSGVAGAGRPAVLGATSPSEQKETRILIQPSSGPLPDEPEALMDVVGNPASIAQAVGALNKLGEIYRRDVIDDNTPFSYDNFHPTVVFGGISANPETNRTFVACAIPLRRALARHYRPQTPEVAMMLDVLAISYWRWFQAERVAVHYLERALQDPRYLDGLEVLERSKESAVKLMGQMLQGLKLLTGRDVGGVDGQSTLNLVQLSHARKLHQKPKRAVSSK